MRTKRGGAWSLSEAESRNQLLCCHFLQRVLNGFVALADLIGAQQHFARRRNNGPGRDVVGAHMQADLTCSAAGEPQ